MADFIMAILGKAVRGGTQKWKIGSGERKKTSANSDIFLMRNTIKKQLWRLHK